MSNYKFKSLLKTKIITGAFNYLQNSRKRLSKGSQIKYSILKIQSYLTSNKLSNDDKLLLFKLRTEMTYVKANFSKMYDGYTNCDLCNMNISQTDSHMLECSKMIEKCPELEKDCETEYEDIFCDELLQLRAVKLFRAVFKTKEEIEEN